MEHRPFDPMGRAAAEDFSGQRSASRDSLLLTAQLRVGAEAPVQVRVRNLSAGGLMAEYAAPIANGTPVEVDVRGIGWVPGRIAWAAEGRVGIRFDLEIDPMLARKPVGGGTHTPVYTKPIITRR